MEDTSPDSIVLLHFVMVSGLDIIALVQEKARNNPNGCSSEPRHAAARPKLDPSLFKLLFFARFFYLFFFARFFLSFLSIPFSFFSLSLCPSLSLTLSSLSLSLSPSLSQQV